MIAVCQKSRYMFIGMRVGIVTAVLMIVIIELADLINRNIRYVFDPGILDIFEKTSIG